MDTSPSVLIVRLDAVGDALALVPLLAALRERAARIDVVLTPRNAEVFSKNAVDRVFVATFPQRDLTRGVRAQIDDLGKELAAHPYDYALIATEDPAGYRLAQLSKARERIGFDNGWGKPIKTLQTRMLCTRTVHRTAGLDPRAPHECEVVFSLGKGIVSAQQPTRDPAVLRPLVVERDDAPDPRIVMQVTSKWERLGASLEELAELAAAAQDRHSVRFVSAETERDYGRQFAERTGAEIEYFSALPDWKNAIASARALVAPDSGAVHVAGMTGTPVVAIFSPQHFRIQVARWSPWAAPYRAVELEKEWPAKSAAALNDLLSGTPSSGKA